MVDEQNEDPQDAPSFVPDDAASAGTEKPSVAPDDEGQDPTDGEADSPPDAFAIEDAITKTAVDGPDDA